MARNAVNYNILLSLFSVFFHENQGYRFFPFNLKRKWLLLTMVIRARVPQLNRASRLVAIYESCWRNLVRYLNVDNKCKAHNQLPLCNYSQIERNILTLTCSTMHWCFFWDIPTKWLPTINWFHLRMYLPFWKVFFSYNIMREKEERVCASNGRKKRGREAFDPNGIGLYHPILTFF